VAAIAVAAATAIHRSLPARDVRSVVEEIGDQGSGNGNQVSGASDQAPEPEEETFVAASPAASVANVAAPNVQPSRDLGAPISVPQLPLNAPRPPLLAVRPATTNPGSPILGPSSPVPDSRSLIPDPPPSEEPLVRGTLERYAKAYSDLNVEAVALVWPSVNRAALERAFESLDSERVSLGNCRIRIDGTTAHASCAGTGDRSWDFDLEKSAEGWQITSARVRN
jgi:hypothetical protein